MKKMMMMLLIILSMLCLHSCRDSESAPQLQFGNQYTGGAEQWYIMDLNSLK